MLGIFFDAQKKRRMPRRGEDGKARTTSSSISSGWILYRPYRDLLAILTIKIENSKFAGIFVDA